LQYDKTGRNVTVYGQGKGCLKIVYEYINQLKKLGKYDDSTIIITADHGNIPYYDAENERPSIATEPIMLVKEPYQSNDSIVVSNAPVSQGEIMPTVLKNIGVEYSDLGETFDEVGEDEDRQRFYRGITLDGVEKLFVINGDAGDLDNWSVAQ
jgi:phosphopentomutase